MDEAFLDILAEKNFQYITVKEICQRAGVHRSTFYLHYETMADLLNESVESIMAEFYRHFQHGPLLPDISGSPLEELMLIDSAHLLPYLPISAITRGFSAPVLSSRRHWGCRAAIGNCSSRYSTPFWSVFRYRRMTDTTRWYSISTVSPP